MEASRSLRYLKMKLRYLLLIAVPATGAIILAASTGPMVGLSRVVKAQATVVSVAGPLGFYRWTNSITGSAQLEMQCTLEGSSDKAMLVIKRTGLADLEESTQNGEISSRIASVRINPGSIVEVTNMSGAGASATIDRILIHEE